MPTAFNPPQKIKESPKFVTYTIQAHPVLINLHTNGRYVSYRIRNGISNAPRTNTDLPATGQAFPRGK